MKNAIIILAVILTSLIHCLAAPNDRISENDYGMLIKFGLGGTLPNGWFASNFDAAVRYKKYLVGYAGRGLESNFLNLFGESHEEYTIYAATFRYIVKTGTFVMMTGAGLGRMRGGWVTYSGGGGWFGEGGEWTEHFSSSFCGLVNLDLGVYFFPVSINVAIEPIFSKRTFVPVYLNLCLFF